MTGSVSRVGFVRGQLGSVQPPRAPSGRRGRSRSTSSRSDRGRAPRAPSVRTRREIACSLERPPASTATRSGRLTESASCRGRAVKRPTNSVTTEFGFACVPPIGSCEITMPSRVGSSVSSSDDARPEPGRLERCLCDRHVLVRDVGNRRRRRAPARPRASPWSPSSCSTLRSDPGRRRSPSRAPRRRRRERRTKPARWSSEAACSYGRPMTLGTVTGFGPRETLIRTGVPSTTTVPGAGDWPVTVPGPCPSRPRPPVRRARRS